MHYPSGLPTESAVTSARESAHATFLSAQRGNVRLLGRVGHDPPVARNEYLELADWRRRVASMWDTWRAASASDPQRATAWFRSAKDTLFAEHLQSPLLPEERGTFKGLAYWPYDLAWRMEVPFEPDVADGRGPHGDESASGGGGFGGGVLDLPSSGLGGIPFRRIGVARLSGPLDGHALPVYWIDAYGGGLFLPIRDATAGKETYGAGRYLLDTIKGADHGGDFRMGTILLDFNLAYHPSCAYDPRWSCPLAPPQNRLPVEVPVGERLRSDAAPHA